MELTQEGVEKLDVGQHKGALLCKGLLLDAIDAGDKLEEKVEKLTKEIAKLKTQHYIQKWHYTKEGDYPAEDGEYQVIVKLNNRQVYETTCDHWDCDLQSFLESCYPENIVAWAEMKLQPEDLMEHV